MPLGQNPGFEGEPRGVWRQGYKILVLSDYARTALGFLADDVAEDAALLVKEVLLGALELLNDLSRQNRQRDQLRVSVLQGSARGLSVILENQDVLEAAVFFQVQNAVSKGPQHIFHALGRKGGQGSVVIGGLDDDFVGADAVHLVEHALGLPVQIAFNTQGRELVGNDANGPARGVFRRRRPTVGIGAISLDFRRSLVFVAVAEGTKTASEFYRFPGEVRGTFGAIGRNNDPATHNGVFPQFRQCSGFLSSGVS